MGCDCLVLMERLVDAGNEARKLTWRANGVLLTEQVSRTRRARSRCYFDLSYILRYS